MLWNKEDILHLQSMGFGHTTPVPYALPRLLFPFNESTGILNTAPTHEGTLRYIALCKRPACRGPAGYLLWQPSPSSLQRAVPVPEASQGHMAPLASSRQLGTQPKLLTGDLPASVPIGPLRDNLDLINICDAR